MKKALLLVMIAGCAFAQTKAVAPVKPAAPPEAKPSLLNPASLNKVAPAEFDVKFTTTKGEFTVHVTKAWAPRGADRFYNLVNAGFFTGVAFFRVIPGFMAQFGMNPDPAVTRAFMQQDIKDDKVTQSNKRGRLTFAQTGAPNSRGTQLFINFKDNTFLDDKFAPIGEVTEGMGIVDSLYGGYGDAPTGPDQGRITAEGKAYLDKSFPKLDKILSAKIVTAPAAAK